MSAKGSIQGNFCKNVLILIFRGFSGGFSVELYSVIFITKY